MIPRDQLMRHVEDIASSFEEIMKISVKEREVLAADDPKGESMKIYLSLQGKRQGLMERIERLENQIISLTGVNMPPYQYKEDVFINRDLFVEYDKRIGVIRKQIMDIMASDSEIERLLMQRKDIVAEKIGKMAENRKAIQAYNGYEPGLHAWFVDRKK